MTVRATRRLPGVRFDPQASQLPESLPRMDIAAFVGFAASGPLHVPVAVEDAKQFAAIFGADAGLAWDGERNEPVRAHLGPSVRSFFRNGGRRCWVVRVAADTARRNWFPIPGLAVARFDADGTLQWMGPAALCARSAGSWSDALRVRSGLASESVTLIGPQPLDLTGGLIVDAAAAVAAGDLLRLSCAATPYRLLVAADEVGLETTGSPPPPRVRRVTGRALLWVSTEIAKLLSAPGGPARYLAARGANGIAGDALPGFTGPDAEDLCVVHCTADIAPPAAPSGAYGLHLDVALEAAPAPGALVAVEVDNGELWLCVRTVALDRMAGSPPRAGVYVEGDACFVCKTAPLPALTVVAAERLSFDLSASAEGERSQRVDGLGFVPTLPSASPASSNVRFVGDLPTDEVLHDQSSAPFAAGRTEIAFDKSLVELWRSSPEQRFPLAAAAAADVVYLPLLISTDREPIAGALARPELPLVRDGLNSFDADLFLDARLRDASTFDLLPRADAIRFAGPTLSRLTGIHAALGLGGADIGDEATLIAVPDAVHRRWEKPVDNPPTVAPLHPLGARAWFQQRACDLPRWWHIAAGEATADEPCCAEAVSDVNAPTAAVAPVLDAQQTLTGTVTLSWSFESVEAPRFIVEQARSADFGDAVVVYDGGARSYQLEGGAPSPPAAGGVGVPFIPTPGADGAAPSTRAGGTYFYRVRETSSQWSVPLAVREPGMPSFRDCSLLPPPQLSGQVRGDSVILEWTQAAPFTGEFALAQSRDADFVDPLIVYRGDQRSFVVPPSAPGTSYYRVRALSGSAVSSWSEPLAVHQPSPPPWRLEPLEQFADADLLTVHRALLTLCRARGDLFAALSLPEHYWEGDAQAHVDALRAAPRPGATSFIPTLDGQASSYAALYYPWVIVRDDDGATGLRRTPADGVATGILAARSIARGAWIAPANEVLRDVVALTPAIRRDAWLALQEKQINLVRQEPRGFVVLSADTLSRDDDLRPIGVRRLLMLLRRLALRKGAEYVFEPNDDSFRRSVQRGFEALLDDLFQRGAFAGRTAASSYQVVTDASLNTPQSVDVGRFIVELRVAPSLPLNFLTVRLRQTGERGSVTEGR